MKQLAERRLGALTLYIRDWLILLFQLYFKPFTLRRQLSKLTPVTAQPSSVLCILGIFTVPTEWRRFLNRVRGIVTILSLLNSLCLLLVLPSVFNGQAYQLIFPPSSNSWAYWISIELCFCICVWLPAFFQLKITGLLLLVGILAGLIWFLYGYHIPIFVIPGPIVYGLFMNTCISLMIFSSREEKVINKCTLLIIEMLVIAAFGALVGSVVGGLTWAVVVTLVVIVIVILKAWQRHQIREWQQTRRWTEVWMWRWTWTLMGEWATFALLALLGLIINPILHIFTNKMHYLVRLTFAETLIFLLVVPSVAFVLVCVIWGIEYVWACLLYLLSRRGHPAFWLNDLPYHLDEANGLSLPFMASLISNAYQDDPTHTKQIVQYLDTSTDQQYLVLQVRQRCILNPLKHCRTVKEIAEVGNDLNWDQISSLAPEEWETFLSDLLKVSQGIKIALSISDKSHRVLLLKDQATLLDRIHNYLLFPASQSQYTKDADQIVQQWIRIVKREQKIAEEQAQRGDNIPSAYVAGPALNPEKSKGLFKGRKKTFDEILNFVRSPQPPILLLYGERRTGKTSILKYLPQSVGSDIVPLLIDLQGAAIARTLEDLAEYLTKQIQKEAWETRNMELPKPAQGSPSHGPFFILQTWFKSIEQQWPEKRFLLCLDEFEKLGEVVTTIGNSAPLDFLRHLSQHNPRWIVLFSGSHALEELPFLSSYLINTLTINIDYLQEAEARDLILHPTADFPQIYDDQAVELILDLTHRHPYLIQLLCLSLVMHLNRTKRRRVTPDDVEQIVPQALTGGGMFFSEFWASLRPEQQQVARSLAQGKQPVSALERDIAHSLVRRGIITRSEQDGYRFQIPLFKLYIQRMATDVD